MCLKFTAQSSGVTWSVYDESYAILHNLEEWQAKAICAILNGATDHLHEDLVWLRQQQRRRVYDDEGR
jgi:hypothetical protein